MSVKITAPTNGTQLNLGELVEFQGTASDSIVTIRLLSPLGTNKFLLGKVPVTDGKWSLSYNFNTGGEREIIASGFDDSDDMVASDEVKIQLLESEDGFDFPEPTNSQRRKSLTLWATFYNIHRAKSVPGGNSLLDKDRNPLGPTLSNQDWCFAALEGTVQVKDENEKFITYNFAGRGSSPQVDCSVFFPSLSASIIQGMNRSRFAVARGAFGDGAGGFILVPYRTIAVDRTFIPLGSVIYIPAARGKKFTLPSGQAATHDGYFLAADVGGAIVGEHIDVFLGVETSIGQFNFIKSNSRHTFPAFLIENSSISRTLTAAHKVGIPD
jgi:3D (Asp-Asp-Asp) domain-containing protein